MREFFVRQKYVFFLLLSAGLFLFFISAYYFIPSFGGLTWKGYYTVLLEADADIEEASQRLEEGGFRGFLSAATAELEFSDFDRMETVTVKDLPGRLHAEDPRLDEYMKGAARLLQSGSGEEHILYFPVRESPPALSAKLRKALAGYDWSFVDWQGGRRFVLIFFYLLIVAVVVRRAAGRRLLTAAFALPWLASFIHGGPGGFAGAVLLYLGLLPLIEEALPWFDHFLYDEAFGFTATPALRERAASLGLVGAGAIFLTILLEGGIPAMVPILFGLGGSAALAATIALLRRQRRAGREHRIFVPLPILPRNWRAGGTSPDALAPVLILSLILLFPTAYKYAGSGEGVSIPKPVSVSGIGGMSRENLRELWFFNRDDRLPDFADYLCHRAFQQGFFYGFPQEFPEADARVALARFTARGGVIICEEETIAKYDEAWYKGELKAAGKSGLGGLLLEQGAKGVSLEPAGGTAMNVSYFIRYCIIVTLAFLPVLFASLGARPRLVTFLKSIELRRKQQAA